MIITTCGHIDHGKTTLVQALTGTNTDRLPEEKRRGMTIELGYARWKLSDELGASFVDVPGHEKLLRNMLAGCIGADIALLVIDINEGIKPQTLEHLLIMDLLKIAGVVVFTKCVNVSETLIMERQKQLLVAARGTIFELAPLFFVDSLTGLGLEQLRAGVGNIAAALPKKNPQSPVRMWIDRVFTKHGSGTIVTGSLLSGTIAIGDSLMLLPQNEQVRVRAIQIFNETVKTTVAGNRVAINIAGATRPIIQRQSLLTSIAGAHINNQCEIQLFAGITPGYVRAYFGTVELQGRIKRLKTKESVKWHWVSVGEFPVMADERIIFRAINTRQILGVSKMILPVVTDKRKTKELSAAKEKPTELSIGDVLYSYQQLEEYLTILRKHFVDQPMITLAQFRDAVKLNREQAKNILEYFDTQKLTLRADNSRVALEKLFNHHIVNE